MGSMLFGEVIKVSKIERMHFSSYFGACDESGSYLASLSYEALEKKFFTKNCSLGLSLPGDILSFQKRIRFHKVRRTKMFLKWYSLDYKKQSLKVCFSFFVLASFVFDETWCVQITNCKVYDHQIRRLQYLLFENNQIPHVLYMLFHIEHIRLFLQTTFDRNTVET